jgi:NodT family efflux transporter outer membrane factor (OMF) lipoprotein
VRGTLRALGVAMFLAVSGCVVGPRYVTPGTPTPAKGPFVSAALAGNADQPLPPYWWRLYQDPILDRLVLQALAENQDLRVAAANLAYAQALLDEARAGQFPTTNATASAVYGRSGLAASGGQGAALNYAAGFTASYQIDLFGRIRRTIEAARANAQAEAAAEDAVRVTVAGETASAYANICGYAQQIAVARRSLEVVQKAYDLTVVQRNAGALADFDVDREGVLLEQTRASIAPLEGQRRAALFTLAALIGKTPSEVPADAAACSKPPTLVQPLPVGDGAALLRRRPDLREADRQLAAATARIGVAAADLYPTVTLGGSVLGAATQLGQLFNSAGLSYSVGPLITWTFPNILVASAHVKEARAQASGALASFNASVLTALKETEQALSTYASELDHQRALATARADAEDALRLAEIQYRVGAASFLDLLQAQSAAVNAEQALAQSDQAVSADQVAVFQALGGGWEGAPPVKPLAIPKG